MGVRNRKGFVLPLRQIQVLKFIAENGPASAYQIMLRIKMPYATSQKSVKDLERQQFILLHEERKNEKGMNAKIYRLTLKGLLVALSEGVDLSRCADKWADLLPLVLGKINYLKAMGVYDLVHAFLKEEAKHWQNVTYDQWNDELASYEVMAHFRDFIFKAFVFDEKWRTLFKAVRNDSQLRAWASEALKGEIALAEAVTSLMRHQLTLIESRDEPDWPKAEQTIQTLQNILLAHI